MRLFNQKLTKTYATPANVEKAVEKAGLQNLRYIIGVDGTGRYIAVFLGQEGMDHGVVHRGFCVAG